MKINWKKISELMPLILQLLQTMHELLDPPKQPKPKKKPSPAAKEEPSG